MLTGAHAQQRSDETGNSLAQLVWENECSQRTPQQILAGLDAIWSTMRACILRSCYTHGVLPGGLKVARRAAYISRKLLGTTDPFCTDDVCLTSVEPTPENIEKWTAAVRRDGQSFHDILKWVSCFALAVNEENAAFGRVVTAPTNGAAGVVPAVLLYAELFGGSLVAPRPEWQGRHLAHEFLLVASLIGAMFKHGATISAAMGGCQAEIGVSSAMAAAALTHVLGGSCAQSLMAAEIAMEHHLGMTCDPVNGLVQIPCIERNTMGAIKAITAANIAIESNPKHARVSLDSVIATMWQTAQDMSTKYKETAEGGLAVQVSVGLSEC